MSTCGRASVYLAHLGVRGPEGPQGIQGERGPEGLQGPKGEAGESFRIMAYYRSEEEMNLDYLNPEIHEGQFVALILAENKVAIYIKGASRFEFLVNMEGVQGPQGDRGPAGSTGPKGDQGIPGPKGDTGAQGPQGLKGDTGAVGERGPQGPKGDRGDAFSIVKYYNSVEDMNRDFDNPEIATGNFVGVKISELELSIYEKGLVNFGFVVTMQGTRGPKGDTGEPGPRGFKGEDGIQGEPGNSATITEMKATVSNTTGVPAVEVINGGTGLARTFTLNFTNIKGEKGDVGPEGKASTVPGPQGERGLTGPAPVRGVDYWTASDIQAMNTANEQYIDSKLGPIAAQLDAINGEVF